MQPDSFSADTLLAAFVSTGWSIVLAVVIFAIGWVASKWVNRRVFLIAQKRSRDAMLGKFLASIAQWAVVAAAAIAALGRVGIETASLVALLASAGVAIGLALQGNLSNFASGVMILIFRPLEIGDVVQVGGFIGKVDDIGIFASTLVTAENNTVIVPNSQITGGVLTNFTRRGSRRASVDVGVAYGTDLAQARDVLMKAAQACPFALEDPAPAIVFMNLGASSLDFSVRVWAKNDDFMAMQDDVRSRVYDDLNAAGIDIPFAQIVVHPAPGEADDA